MTVKESNKKSLYNHVPVVPNSKINLNHYTEDIRNLPREHFRIVKINHDDTLELIFEKLGKEREVQLSFKEIAKFLFEKNVDRYVVIHNHPTDNVTPSLADKVLLTDLTMMSKILRIKLEDFLIVSSNDCYSQFQHEEILDKQDKILNMEALSFYTYFALQDENDALASFINMVTI